MNVKLSRPDRKVYHLRKGSWEEPGSSLKKINHQGTDRDSLDSVAESDAGAGEQCQIRQLAPVQIRKPFSESERAYDQELIGSEPAIVQEKHDGETDHRSGLEGTPGSFGNNDNDGGVAGGISDGEESPVPLAGSHKLKKHVQQGNKLLHFYGVVRDNNNKVVEGAVVMLSACFAGGNEKVLEHTFTDREGAYFVSVPVPPDDIGITGFKVRAGKAGIIPENKNIREYNREERKGSLYPRDLQGFFKMFYPGI